MRWLLVLPLLVLGQVAHAEAPAQSPRPHSRAVAAPIAQARPSAPFMAASAATIAAPSARPLARPKGADPAVQVIPQAGTAARPQRRPERKTTGGTELYQIVSAAVRTQPAPEAIIGRKGTGLCGVPGIEGQTIAPIASTVRGCGVPEPVRVTAVDGVRLSQASVMDCSTARALNTWVQRGVKPAVDRTGGGVTQIQIAGHYVCRPRNNVRGASVSEHGRGKAVDVSGLRLANGETISVLKGWRDRRHSNILRQMHRSACGIFGTTLGPGSDGHHEDHLHYDTASHRNGAYCR